ncbi:MAG: tRNA (guanosine(37)-N1)-methyltransferase TrmD [Actinobacteria bacterium]|nr:tRNA (guanosine(37)-N1)-methyltransferase TrmD [Actinomycetota bacterium]MCB9412874.1 tRNA (guanosine(37)-N1)-methyltransferase TrmD [Actinomycetota bacterium]
MRIDILTVFPEYLAPLSLSLVGKARRNGTVSVDIHDLRDWTHDRHRTVDDAPYGGGPGMVMRADVWGEAIDAVLAVDSTRFDSDTAEAQPVLVIPTPSGRRFTQSVAADLAGAGRLVIACGRYEGIDARVAEHYRERMRVEELSVADVVVAGGEVAALLITEAIVRLLPGVLGNALSAEDDSFAPSRPADGALEGPVYTRPPVWRGLPVPAVLTSGDHEAVRSWRVEQSRTRTAAMRPDLLD